uniref:Transportin-3 n=1 Tax=Aceria tosichella TaxID=561515 RepID=A0A6G1SBS6_9ACAR
MFPAPNASVTPLTDKPPLETVKDAIRSVLSQNTTVDRKAATDYLAALESSVFAWEICDELLQTRESIEISYLAAHMLRQKISKHFNELPIECYSSLKDSILNHLQSIDDYAVQGQLTMAIADLTLLLQVWQNPIEDLAKQLGLEIGLITLTSAGHETLFKALNNRLIFAYIMHQMCDLNHDHSHRPCRIGARRREEFENYLISKCGQAITWWLNTIKEVDELKLYLNSSESSTVKLEEKELLGRVKCLESLDKLMGQIYLCYSAWLRIFNEENVSESLTLIDGAFKNLHDTNCPEAIHKYAVEVIVATSSYCEDNRQVDYLVNHLVEQVYTLENAFKETVSQEDIDKSSNFVKAFTSVAETACFTHVIEKQDFRLIELLLSCLSHYDYEIVEETYQFWWTLLETLQNRLKPAQYPPYIGYINRFVMGVTKLAQFDADEEGVVHHDADIHSFRANSAEIIVHVMYVTTIEDFIRDNSLLENFSYELSKISWEKNEAVLFLISCLTQLMTRENNQLRVQIFNGIICQQMNNQDIQGLLATKQVAIKIGNAPGEVHPQIVATSLRIIGSMEGFLANQPDYLVLAINYILAAISNEKHRNQLIKPAASALCNIMESHANRHLSSCPQLLVIIKDLCSSLDQFEEQAASELLKCSAFMADAVSDVTLKNQFLCEILNPIINSLKATLTPPKRDEAEPVKYLDRISSVFKQLTIHKSVVPQLTNFISLVDLELWPTIVKVLEIYASERGHAIEQTCRTIRYMLRCIKPEWMIERVAETMISLYKTYPQNSSPLYICSILVDEFANTSPEINQGLFTMLEIFCTLTFTLLNMTASQAQSLLSMKNYPETIDDMMRLFNRFLRKCPNDFVNCKALESIIELSISSLRIDHLEANANVSKFVTSFIALGQNPDYPRISDAIKNVLGARITDAVIKACLFDIPSFLIGEEAQILMTLYSFDKDLFSKWVEASVLTLPKTNIQGIESVTSEQLDEFKTTLISAGSLKKMVNCLRATARLYS